MIELDKLAPSIWDVSPFPIVVTGHDSERLERKIVYVNSAFSQLTGYTAREAIGQPETLLDGPRTDSTKAANREALLQMGKTSEALFVHYRKDGSEYLSRTAVAPLVEPDGTANFLMFIELLVSSIGQSAPDDETPHAGAFVPLTLPMPLQEHAFARMPEHLPSHPELDVLRDLWMTIRGARVLPKRIEFGLDAVKRWAPNLSIATVTPDGRFQFRLFGTELTRVYGRDLTGSFLDELTPKDLWSVVTMHYREVVRTRLPLFAPISIANGRWYNEVSRMLLPLGEGGDDVSFVMGADYPRRTS